MKYEYKEFDVIKERGFAGYVLVCDSECKGSSVSTTYANISGKKRQNLFDKTDLITDIFCLTHKNNYKAYDIIQEVGYAGYILTIKADEIKTLNEDASYFDIDFLNKEDAVNSQFVFKAVSNIFVL